MIKYVNKKCERCGEELIHVRTNQRFCQDCAKARQRERDRKRKRRKRDTYKLWQGQEISDKERYRNKLQCLTDNYRYGARHIVNETVIRQVKNIGNKLGYTGSRIIDDIEQAKLEAESGVKCYRATPEEIKEMLGE